ncbi:MAG TPA: hypothetical protein VGO85_13830 [Caldimonas sp.]|jgi:hypothetical protein|nr:hypothetical protein [Caldimonas sp.]
MRNVLWICAAVASVLTLADARAEGEGLAANADRVPWARFQSRIAYAPGAPGWRADLAPLERSGLKVGSVGLLGDVYFGSTEAARATSAGGFRATSGVLIGPRSPWLGAAAAPPSNGLLAIDRRLFGASANAAAYPADSALESATVPYIGIGYSNLSGKSGWSFSADLGVVSQSPGNVVRFGRVFGGSQSLDDVVRDMRLAPVIQLGVSYSF